MTETIIHPSRPQHLRVACSRGGVLSMESHSSDPGLLPFWTHHYTHIPAGCSRQGLRTAGVLTGSFRQGAGPSKWAALYITREELSQDLPASESGGILSLRPEAFTFCHSDLGSESNSLQISSEQGKPLPISSERHSRISQNKPKHLNCFSCGTLRTSTPDVLFDFP